VKEDSADTGDGPGVDTPALDSQVSGKTISETSEAMREVSRDQADQSPTNRHTGSDGVVGGSDKENETPRGSSGHSEHSGQRSGGVDGDHLPVQDHVHGVDGAKWGRCEFMRAKGEGGKEEEEDGREGDTYSASRATTTSDDHERRPRATATSHEPKTTSRNE
jgi:hypothetical protein